MGTLEQRLNRLERQNKSMRCVLGAFGLLLAASLLWGASKPIPEIIQARRFEVINDQGKPAVALYHWNGGGGVMAVRDPEGKSKGTFAVAKEGDAYLLLNDGAGVNRVQMGTSNYGSGGVWITDKAGTEIETLSSLHALDTAMRTPAPAQPRTASFLSTAFDVLRFMHTMNR